MMKLLSLLSAASLLATFIALSGVVAQPSKKASHHCDIQIDLQGRTTVRDCLIGDWP